MAKKLLTGESTWTNESGRPIDGGKVTEAIMRDKEIVFDFIQDQKNHNAKLISNDGIYYKGEYELNKIRKGKAEFKLYENKKGYFLFGSYEGHMPEEGRGLWWIELDK